MKRYENLKKEIAKCQPKTIVEIGTWNGRNSSIMINEAKKYNQNIKYYGFDIFDADEELRTKEKHTKLNATYNEAKSNIESTGVEYEIIVGNTIETLPGFFKNKRAIDFAWIDGGHSLETIENDWNCIKGFLSSGAVVLFDDYYPDNTSEGCKVLTESLDRSIYSVQLLSPVDTFGDLKVGIVMVKPL